MAESRNGSVQDGRSATEHALRAIRRIRGRYTADQVTWIREQYLLEGLELSEIREKLWPKCTVNALWRIAVGRSYPEVSLSERLLVAHREAEELRRVPPPTGRA